MRDWLAATFSVLLIFGAILWASADAHYGWPAGALGLGLGVSHTLCHAIGKASASKGGGP